MLVRFWLLLIANQCQHHATTLLDTRRRTVPIIILHLDCFFKIQQDVGVGLRNDVHNLYAWLRLQLHQKMKGAVYAKWPYKEKCTSVPIHDCTKSNNQLFLIKVYENQNQRKIATQRDPPNPTCLKIHLHACIKYHHNQLLIKFFFFALRGNKLCL